MKHTLIAAAMLLLTACTTQLPPAPPPASTAAPPTATAIPGGERISLSVAKTLTLAHRAYAVAARAATSAADAGLVRGETAQELRELNARAYAALGRLDRAGDGVSRAAAATDVLGLAAEILALVEPLLKKGAAR